MIKNKIQLSLNINDEFENINNIFEIKLSKHESILHKIADRIVSVKCLRLVELITELPNTIYGLVLIVIILSLYLLFTVNTFNGYISFYIIYYFFNYFIINFNVCKCKIIKNYIIFI